MDNLSENGHLELRRSRLKIEEALIEYERGSMDECRRPFPGGGRPSHEFVAARIAQILSLKKDFSVCEFSQKEESTLRCGRGRGRHGPGRLFEHRPDARGNRLRPASPWMISPFSILSPLISLEEKKDKDKQINFFRAQIPRGEGPF